MPGRRAYLAIDLGASSGRAMIGVLDDGRMHMEEIHRFRTPLLEDGGRLTWDSGALTSDVLRSLTIAVEHEPELRSVSVDSWGVDYVSLGADDAPARASFAYRDARTSGRMLEASRMFGPAHLYKITGTQFLDINTLPQLLAEMAEEVSLAPCIKQRLLIADYFLHILSGVSVAERTLASTTQLMDVRSGQWSREVIETVGDDMARWPRIVPPGTVLGPARRDLLPTDHRSPPMVIATCSHDTAAAVAAIPALTDEPWAFISTGTWSLVGAELDAPILSEHARAAGFTNESGLDGTIRFLKNRMGMWVFEECARIWGIASDRDARATLLAQAEHTAGCGVTLDLDAPAFAQRGPMLELIATACVARGIVLPTERASVVRLILESMAASFARAVDELDSILGRRTESIHLVGGGARNRLLNQLTADACARRVVAGPFEATALGNLLVQARTMGDLLPGTSLRAVADRSGTLEIFEPTGRAVPRASTTPLR